MDEKQRTLQKYTSDMLALERHIHEAIVRQKDMEELGDLPSASQVIDKAEATLKAHIDNLTQHLVAIGGDLSSPAKEAVSAVFGIAASVIDRMRGAEAVSKALRDDYTALNMASIAYTMLHATALALHDEATSDLATDHLMDLTPIITEINEVIPEVTLRELATEMEGVDTAVANQAVRNTQEAWDSAHIHSTHAHSQMRA